MKKFKEYMGTAIASEKLAIEKIEKLTNYLKAIGFDDDHAYWRLQPVSNRKHEVLSIIINPKHYIHLKNLINAFVVKEDLNKRSNIFAGISEIPGYANRARVRISIMESTMTNGMLLIVPHVYYKDGTSDHWVSA